MDAHLSVAHVMALVKSDASGSLAISDAAIGRRRAAVEGIQIVWIVARILAAPAISQRARHIIQRAPTTNIFQKKKSYNSASLWPRFYIPAVRSSRHKEPESFFFLKLIRWGGELTMCATLFTLSIVTFSTTAH